MKILRITKKNSISNIRKKCLRSGNHFIPSYYKNREHLIPVKDHGLIKLLTEIESQRPDKEHVERYSLWKKQVEDVRYKIKKETENTLSNAWILAMTTTRAAFTFDILKDTRFDLIVFDEASQVSIAHALSLAPLGNHCIFVGDPKQLSPIVSSKNPQALKWIGNSIFYYKNNNSKCTFLNEQSRMAKPICDLVSKMFYDDKLIVANDKINDPIWLVFK